MNLLTKTLNKIFKSGNQQELDKIKPIINELKVIVNNKGVILCDDYDLTYAPGVKKAIDEYVLLNNFNLRILNSRFAEITKNSTENWFNKTSLIAYLLVN